MASAESVCHWSSVGGIVTDITCSDLDIFCVPTFSHYCHQAAVTLTLFKISRILGGDLNRDVTTNVIFHTSSFRYFFK